MPGDDLVAIADTGAPGGGRPRRRCRGHHLEDRVEGRGAVGARGRSRGRRGGRDRAGGGSAGRPGDRRDPARVRVRERRGRCLEPGHGHAGAAAARPRRHGRTHPARTARRRSGPGSGWSSRTRSGAPGERAWSTWRSAAPALPATVDLRGRPDDRGRALEATVVALADEIAAASGLVMGKDARVPVALVRGVRRLDGTDGPATDLIRPADEDLFRTSTHEAIRSLSSGDAASGSGPIGRELLIEAIGACATPWPPGGPRRGCTVVEDPDEVATMLRETAGMEADASTLIVPWLEASEDEHARAPVGVRRGGLRHRAGDGVGRRRRHGSLVRSGGSAIVAPSRGRAGTARRAGVRLAAGRSGRDRSDRITASAGPRGPFRWVP